MAREQRKLAAILAADVVGYSRRGLYHAERSHAPGRLESPGEPLQISLFSFWKSPPPQRRFEDLAIGRPGKRGETLPDR